jgi:hypothetical protein
MSSTSIGIGNYQLEFHKSQSIIIAIQWLIFFWLFPIPLFFSCLFPTFHIFSMCLFVLFVALNDPKFQDIRLKILCSFLLQLIWSNLIIHYIF